MIKGTYIINNDLNDKLLSGVNNKIKAQIKAFSDAGFKIDTKLYSVGHKPLAKVLYRLPFVNINPKWEYSHDFDDCDFIYMRKPNMSMSYVRFLKEIKKYSKAKIIVEFMTYPYDGELKGRIIDYPLYWKDLNARKRMKGFVDRIATLTEDAEIFGIPTVKIVNGYDFSKIQIQNSNRSDDELRICCVARFMSWHGYERLLRGMAKYYQNNGRRNVIVYMVGDGPELPLYRKLVDQHSLGKHVRFTGHLNTDQINDTLNKCDIGAASFGTYKVGYYGMGAFLKTREYLAAGLPVLAANELDYMQYQKLKPYTLVFPNDDSIIEIDKIIRFYDNIMISENDIVARRKKIRKLAYMHLDSSHAIDEVIRYVRETKGE